jgi:hypothetical protein
MEWLPEAVTTYERAQVCRYAGWELVAMRIETSITSVISSIMTPSVHDTHSAQTVQIAPSEGRIPLRMDFIHII